MNVNDWMLPAFVAGMLGAWLYGLIFDRRYSRRQEAKIAAECEALMAGFCTETTCYCGHCRAAQGDPA